MLFNVFSKTCELKDNCIVRISRKATASPDEPVPRFNHSHQHDQIEVFKIVILLACFGSTWWTLDWNVASIYRSPTKGELPPVIHIFHLSIKVVFTFCHVLHYAFLPEVFNN